MMRFLRAVLFSALLALPSLASAQYTTGLRYDALRRLTGEIAPDPDAATNGPLQHPASRYTYRPDGLLERVEKGVLASWQAETVAPSAWTEFTVQARTEFAYDAVGNRIEERAFGPGGAVTSQTQFGYDADGRLICTAVRMNLASPPAAGTNACLPVNPSASTPDRITKNIYDAAGQLLQVRRAVGLSAYEQAETTYSYTPNGKQEHLIDANGNRARFAYDAFDRRSHWYLPSTTMPTGWNPATPATALATAGAASTTDFELYGYDANDNRTSLQKRGHRPGVSEQVIGYGYDALNRMVLKDLPGGNASDVHYAYDLRGLQTQAKFGSLAGSGITQVWDKASRLTSTSDSSSGTPRTLGYGYDPASNRNRITHPDTANFFTYEHDPLNRVTAIREKGAAAIATFLYDDEGRRDSLARAGDTTSYDYDAASRLQALGHVFTQSASNVTMSHTYNAADQVLSRTITNNAYVYSEPANASAVYARNGLNQYTSVGTAQLTWDDNGNLASDGSTGFTYDLENRLTGASGAKTATLRYDPLGRLRESSGGAFGTIRYLYDGDALIAEYDSAGTLLKRYIHGPGIDEPLVWYEGSTVADSTRRNLHANHQGSIVAVTSDSGSTLGINAYDAWGLPEPSNLGRFQYTGQILLYELGLYHYKARTYSPALGRFLQTDPAEYDDQFNLYAYAGNDPLNRIDPLGRESCQPGQTCPDIPRAPPAVAEAAVEAAGDMPISEGNRETAAQVMVHKQDPTRVAEVRTGRAAGIPDRRNPMRIRLNPIRRSDRYRLGTDVHAHPRQGQRDTRELQQRAAQDRVNTRNLYPSRDDFRHMNQTNASFFLKNTAGAIVEVYRTDKVDHIRIVVPGSVPLGPIPSDLTDVVVDN